MLSSKQLDRLSNQICCATGVCNSKFILGFPYPNDQGSVHLPVILSPCKQSYWIQPNLFGDLLTQMGEQEHYRYLFFLVPPCMAPVSVHFLALLSLSELLGWTQTEFVSNLNKLCLQELIFGYPTQRCPANGSNMSAHSSFMLILTCWAEFNLICWMIDFLTSRECKRTFIFYPFSRIWPSKLLVKSVCLSVHSLFMLSPNLLII